MNFVIHRSVLATALAAGVLVGTPLAASASTPAATATSPLSAASATRMLQTVLDARAALWIDTAHANGHAMKAMAMESTHRAAIAVMSAAAVPAEQTAEAGVSAEKADLSSSKEKFSDATVAVSAASLKVSGSCATLTYQQTTKLTMEKVTGSEPPVMADSVKRTATFTLQGSTWKLANVQHVTGASSSLLDALPTTAQVETAIAKRPALSAVIDGQSPASISGAPKTPTTVQLKGLTALGAHTTVMRPMIASYNYGAMISYATSHWNSGDTQFPIWSEDCVNFISRALWHGGWAMDSTWKGGYKTVSIGGGGHSGSSFARVSISTPAFIRSADWFNYANKTSHRTHTTNNVWNMGLADVWQADWNRDGHIDHSMLVTAMSSTDKFVTEHTNNALNKSMKLIIKQNPGTTWYASVT